MNSIARRAWTSDAAKFLSENYRPHDGILARFGDLTGIFCAARIPLAETLHEGNGPAWWAATLRPDLFHPQMWAVAQQGDFVSNAVNRARSAVYPISAEVRVSEAPILEIRRRTVAAPKQ